MGNERKVHWLAWEKLCVPKVEGGMGFRSLPHFNPALLAKQGWRLRMHPDSLVANVFKAKYFPNTSFLEASPVQGMSYTWRSILAGKKVLLRGLRYQIGNGSAVSLWYDPWLPLPYTFKPFSAPIIGTESWLVEDIIDHEDKVWLQPMIEEMFTEADTEIILKIPLSLCHTKDRFVWHYEKKGVFSVKSSYHVAHDLSQSSVCASSSSGSRRVVAHLWKLV